MKINISYFKNSRQNKQRKLDLEQSFFAVMEAPLSLALPGGWGEPKQEVRASQGQKLSKIELVRRIQLHELWDFPFVFQYDSYTFPTYFLYVSNIVLLFFPMRFLIFSYGLRKVCLGFDMAKPKKRRTQKQRASSTTIAIHKKHKNIMENN